MGEYDYKPGGSLKFKGGGEKKKKKKKSSTSEGVRALESTSDKRTDAVVASDSAQARREGSAASASGSGREYERLDSPSTTSVQQGGSGSTSKADTTLLTKHSSTHAQSHMTESERRYDEVRRRRLADKVRKEARKSHKDRVQEFNEKLGKLSEHHDLPRIGPG